MVRQCRVFTSIQRHSSQQESLYSCYLNTRASPCPIRKRYLPTQSRYRFAIAPALHYPSTPEIARSSHHTGRQSFGIDNTESEAVGKALPYQTFGGKNGGLGWHILHITLASAFCLGCLARTASAHGTHPEPYLVLV